MSDVEIQRMVDFLVEYVRDNIDADGVIAPESMAAIREAAKSAHVAWKAMNQEEVPIALELSVGGRTVKLEESFDMGDIHHVFSTESERELHDPAFEQQRKEKERDRKQKEADEEEERKSERKTQQWIGVIVGIVVIFVVAVLVTHFMKNKEEPERKGDKAERKRDDHAGATITATPTPTVTPRVVRRVDVPSCTCISRANGKNTFALEAPATASDDWHFDWNQQSGFQSMHSGFNPGASDAGAATSLAAGVTKLRAAMACENEIVAVVAGDVASAWSATDSGELLWTRKLPAPMADANDAGPTADVSCADAFSVTGNVFTVPLAKGKKITLSIRDGSVH